MKKNFIFIIMTLLMVPTIVCAKIEIGDTKYETLEEAIAQSKEGDTITLLDDVDVSDPDKYDSYTNWLFKDDTTLDLNGHTITTGFKGGAPNSVWLGNGLTIKNGFFKTSANADYTLFLGDIEETSGITVENVTVETGINIFNTLGVTLRNVKATGKTYYAVWLDEHATVTIESGTYENDLGKYVLGVWPTDDFTNELIIEGGTFIASKDKLVLPPNDKTAFLPPIIKGGTYDFDVSEYLHPDYICKKENDKYVVSLKTPDREIIVDDDKTDLTVEIDREKLSEILLRNLEQYTELQVGNKDIDLTLNIEDTVASTDTMAKMQEAIKNGTIAHYFDISIDVIDKSTNQVIGNMTKLDEMITLKIALPEELTNIDGFTRVFYILREHEGVVDIIKPTLSEDKKTLTFKTDRFSTYALAYEERKNLDIDNPQTIDELQTYILRLIVLTLVSSSCAIYLHKQRQF